MKKLLSLLVLMLLPLVASADAVVVDGVYYYLNADDKTAEVTKNPDNYSGCVIIPSFVTYEDVEYTVTSIDNTAFRSNKTVSCVVIGKNVKTIGGSAFNRTQIKNIWSFMETPPEITRNTFLGTTRIATLHVPANCLAAYKSATFWRDFMNIVPIEDNPINDNPIAFADANVKALCVANWDTDGNGELSEKEAFMVSDLNGVFSQNVTISSFKELSYFSNIVSIGDSEFTDCSQLASISLPVAVTSIGSTAFSGCGSLVDIWTYMQTPPEITSTTFPNQANATLHVPVSSIAAYRNANFWKEFQNIVGISNTPLTNNPIAFADANVKALCVANWDTDGDGELSEVEASVVMDLGGVFTGNETITSFDELSYFISLQRIGDTEFKGCSNLASISIPCSVASIGNMSSYANEAFSGCVNLLKVVLHTDAMVSRTYGWGGGIPPIFGSQVEDYILGDEITVIGDFAFYGATNMKSIKISDNVTRIGQRAFEWCYGNLRSVTLPNSLRVIEDYAFHGCDMLPSITIPANVESIGDFAFEQCGSLGRVFCLAKQIPETNYMPFSGSNYPKATLLVPANLINNYRKSEQWNVFGNIVALESAVDGLYYKFDDNAKTAEIVSITEGFGGAVAVPSTVNYSEGQYHVTGIGASAFIGCYDLTSVTIPNSVTSIGESAFQNCTGLTSVVLGEGVASIGASAFYGCTSLPSVVIPSSVENIGVSVFQYCPALTSIKVDNGNAIYDSRENCNAVIATAINTLLVGCQNTVIPEDVTKIGDYAFSSCFGLTSIHIPDGVTEIGPYAFYGCTGLTSITIPSSVATLGYWSLAYCTGLTAVDITNLDAWCSFDFYDLYGNYSNPLYIAKHLYLNGKEVKDLVIPEGVPSIGHCAFQGLTDLASVVIPSSVTKIGIDAFSGCLNMTNVYCYAEQVPVDKEQEGDDYVYSYMWNGFDCQNATLHVPAGSIEDYRNDPKWKNFGNIVALTEEDPKPTAIMNVNNDVVTGQQFYSLDGKRTAAPRRGLNIVKTSDGKIRKVVIK